MTRRWLATAAATTVLGAVAVVLPATASAYATPTVFGDDPVGGGGGGRYFTGTVRDRYTCDVCHEGAATPRVVVDGIPDGPIAWGETYTFTITLEDMKGGAGAVAEVAENGGAAIGTLERLDNDLLEDRELCASGLPAATIYDEPGRTIATMSKCGADRLRVRWTAPIQPTRAARLFVAAVVSDDSGEPLGDGAFAAEYTLELPGDPQPVQTTCAVGQGRTPWALLPLLLLFARRQRTTAC